MLDFTTFKYLACVFTPDLKISNTLKIANLIVDLIGEYVGEDPTLLPTAEGAPSDIPRIIIASPDEKWVVNVSESRTNFFYQIPHHLKEEEIDAAKFFSIASNFLAPYQKGLNLRVQRFSAVTERLYLHGEALKYLQDNFLNKDQTEDERPLDNPKRLEIHSLKKYPWKGYDLNSWVRIKFAPIRIPDSEPTPGFIVINDLNTLPLEEAPEVEFSGEQINAFFTAIPEHLNDILKLYFD